MNTFGKYILVFGFLLTGILIPAAGPGAMKHPENPAECSYADFFSQVMKYHAGLVKTVQAGDCFRVRIHDEQEYFETTSSKYRMSITFYCQYGYSGTENGLNCYGELLDKFISWLKMKGYAVKEREDNSMTGWIKKMYRATSGKGNVLFVYESESAASMGYAKIRLLKEI